MKLVIDISAEKYEWFKKNIKNPNKDSTVGAVALGVPYEEHKQGEWIREVVVEEPRKNKRAYARCSSCGCRYNHYGVAVKHFDYCPNCGARMKGGDEK